MMRSHRLVLTPLFTRTVFVALLILLALGTQRVPGAQASHIVFVVDDTGDGGDSVPGNGACNDGSGSCTLRAAIEEANAHAGADVITFSLPSPSTINVGSELTISTEMTITGNGEANTIIDGGGSTRVFVVTGTSNVTLEDLTVTNGRYDVEGAGIRSGTSGILNLTRVTVSGNVLVGVGAPPSTVGNPARGAGLFVTDGGMLNITDSTFTGNVVTGAPSQMGFGVGAAGGVAEGGAIYVSDTDVTLSGSVISGNSVTGGTGGGGATGWDGGSGGWGRGGGIFFQVTGSNSKQLSMDTTTIDGNGATGGEGGAGGASVNGAIGGEGGLAEGGGIHVTADGSASASVNVIDSTISNNNATGGSGGKGGGGGEYPGTGGDGQNGFGGGLALNGNVTSLVVNSTLSGNGATGGAGGEGGDGTSGGTFDADGGTGGNGDRGEGGGIRSAVTASTSLYSTTVYNNTASGGSGGAGGQPWASSSVGANGSDGGAQGGGIVETDVGPVNLANTILAGNIVSGGGTTQGPDCYEDLVSQGYNLLGDDSNCSGLTNGVNGDQVGNSGSPLDPDLLVLDDYGGPTSTHAINTSSSPPIDAGNPADCTDGSVTLEFDQRGTGFLRHQDGDASGSAVCDAGAYEFPGSTRPDDPDDPEDPDDPDDPVTDPIPTLSPSELPDLGHAPAEGSDHREPGWWLYALIAPLSMVIAAGVVSLIVRRRNQSE